MRAITERKLTLTDTPFDINDQESLTKINMLNDDSFLRLLQRNEVSYYYSYSYPNYIEEAEWSVPRCDETYTQGNREIRCIKEHVLYLSK